jgi:hypothetical protein
MDSVGKPGIGDGGVVVAHQGSHTHNNENDANLTAQFTRRNLTNENGGLVVAHTQIDETTTDDGSNQTVLCSNRGDVLRHIVPSIWTPEYH